MNHLQKQFLEYATSAIKGAQSVDNVVNTQEAYHLQVVKEYELVIKRDLQTLSEKLGVPLNLDKLVVRSSNDRNNDVVIELTHKIFADLREETKYKRIEFSEAYGEITGVYFPVEEVTIQRIILEIELRK